MKETRQQTYQNKHQHLRLIDNPEDNETGDDAGILGGLTLSVVEVGRHGDDGVRHFLAEVRLGSLPHLVQDHRGDLLGCEQFRCVADVYLDVRLLVLVYHLEREVLYILLHRLVRPPTTDHSLHVKDRVLWVGRQLVLGCVSDQTLSFARERDVGRRDTITLVVGNDLHTSVLEYSDTAMTRSID